MHDDEESGLHFLDYWRVIRARKEIVLAVLILVVLTGTLFTLTLPKQFLAQARILVNQDALDVDVFERQFGGGYNPFFLRTQYEILKSRPILEKVVEELSLREKWGKQRNDDGSPITLNRAVRILKNSLNVEQFRETSLIAIQVTREDPAEAAQIANTVADVYLNNRLSKKRREMERAIGALQTELKKQQAIVEKAEEKVENMRQELGINMLGRGIQADRVRLQSLEADRIASRVDMLVRKARLDQLKDLTGVELLNSANYIVQDASLMNIRRQLTDSSVNLRLMLETLGENHPDVRRLRAGINELEVKLDEALEGLKKGLTADYEVSKAKYDTLEEELSLTRAESRDIQRDKILPFQKAELDLAIQRDIMNALRARVAQEGIEIEVPRTPVERIDPALPPTYYVSPNIMLNIAISVVFGLVSGVGLAYFIEYLDTSVKTVDDVERYLQTSVLGVIPQKVKPLIEEGPESPHAESYRVLRTNLLFNNKGLSGGAFAFVSGGVGEGKSTTLFNLAYICAQLGDRVLIVDSDLRRPVQHSLVGMSNRFGLTNVLMRDVPIEEAIHPTSVPNLHMLPSGRMPRSSLGILDSQRMRELVKNLKARYDYVFFDSPPIVGVSDASILASEVDGVLMVVQYRKYPRVISARAKRMIEHVGGNLMGVVLNNINILRDDYYYYYHSYHTDYYQPNEDQENTVASEDKESEVTSDRL